MSHCRLNSPGAGARQGKDGGGHGLKDNITWDDKVKTWGLIVFLRIDRARPSGRIAHTYFLTLDLGLILTWRMWWKFVLHL